MGAGRSEASKEYRTFELVLSKKSGNEGFLNSFLRIFWKQQVVWRDLKEWYVTWNGRLSLVVCVTAIRSDGEQSCVTF